MLKVWSEKRFLQQTTCFSLLPKEYGVVKAISMAITNRTIMCIEQLFTYLDSYNIHIYLNRFQNVQISMHVLRFSLLDLQNLYRVLGTIKVRYFIHD